MADKSKETVTIKWNGKPITVEFSEFSSDSPTLADFKSILESKTNVKTGKQKIIGLKTKEGKKIADSDNDVLLKDLDLSSRIMLMGQPDEIIAKYSEKPENAGDDVVNDLEVSIDDIPLAEREEFVAKIEKRVKDYKIDILNPSREGKKLLVLDIDYTIYDHKSPAERMGELIRPYLIPFLSKAYIYYDIVFWSTGMKWIETKLKEMCLLEESQPFKIAFLLDQSAMISVHTPDLGLTNVKPLAVIWRKFPQYSEKSTIMLDDVSHNFLMNPLNGLKIRAFKNCHQTRSGDTELLKLSDYLETIALKEKDFSKLKHRHWERYIDSKFWKDKSSKKFKNSTS